MAGWGLGTQCKKRRTGAGTSAVGGTPAASSLLALPLPWILDLSKEQAAAWVSFVLAAGVSQQPSPPSSGETPSIRLVNLQGIRRSAGPKCGWELADTAGNRYWEQRDRPDLIYGVTASHLARARFKLPFPAGLRQTTSHESQGDPGQK